MASTKLFLLAALAIAAVSSYPVEHEEQYDHKPYYEFEYSVHDPHTHDIKSQKESRYGDQVKGYYKLKEADGSLREVHYTADHHNGFQAEVTKNGLPLYQQQAQHPEGYYHHEGYGHHAASSQNFYIH